MCKVCEWKFVIMPWMEKEEEGFYQTSCGSEMDLGQGQTAKSNGVVFCPFCGKKIKDYGKRGVIPQPLKGSKK